MKTSSAKAKGRRACAEIKQLMEKWAPDLRPGDIEITSSGVTGEDLKLSPAAREVYPYVIESKNCERLNIWAALKQVESHQTPYPIGVLTALLFFTRNRSRLYVTLPAEDFFKLTR